MKFIQNTILVCAMIMLFSASASAATITVNSTADNTTASDASCTLREAINNSNSDSDTTGGDCTSGSGTDDIEFSIGSGLQTIIITSELPEITDPTNFDATTQPGTQSCTDKDLLIELEADFGLVDASGLKFASGANGSSVRGFYINGFINDSESDNAGIHSDAEITITCNVIGLEPTGLGGDPNTDGIYLTASNSTIGGVVAGDGNIISGNQLNGILITGSNNNVIGNFIGTNIDGTSAIGNGFNGVRTRLFSGTGNTIGPDNLISGNSSNGISFESSSNTAIGNLIGTDITGTSSIANSRGVFINSTFITDITIGGDTADDRNIISGNSFNGIDARGTFGTNLVVQGNYVGTNIDGTAALANGTRGIETNIPASIIGGENAGEGNLVSGNGDDGIEVGDNSVVKGNIVGLNLAGDTAIPNNGRGIVLDGSDSTVGGDTALERNVVSGNTEQGIDVASENNSIIQGNYVGVSADGSTDIGNGDDGIEIRGQNNLVGGPNAGEGNLISGNGGLGIDLNSGTFGAAPTPSVIQGNIVGLNLAGDTAIPNDGGGIVSDDATIGGDTALERNIVSGNTGIGMELFSIGQLIIQGNYIGTDITGVNSIPNTSDGITVSGDNVQIGGENAGEGNLIANNDATGITLTGENYQIEGNFIGVNVNEEASGNSTFGIQVNSSIDQVFNGDEFVDVLVPSTNVTIGGVTSNQANLISANGTAGIFINDSNTDIEIFGNFIGTNSSGAVVPGDLVTDPLGNGRFASAGEDGGGIVAKSSSAVSIGNFDGTGGNIIAGNFGNGVTVSQNQTLSESVVTILSNRIFENSSIGIDLSNDTNDDGFSDSEVGVTANDDGDLDTGANSLLNFINLKAKTDDGGGNFTIDYTLDVPAGNYVVQFYENTTADTTNHGEGETLAETVSITHGGTGEESFSSSITATDVTNLVATVTQDLGASNYGTTSEFSSIEIIPDEPINTGGSGGGGSNGASSGSSSSSSPFFQNEREPEPEDIFEDIVDECSFERNLKEIEQFRGFEREVSRYEALEYVLLINCIGLDDLPENPNDYPFSDVNLESTKMARVLYTGFNRGIVKGYPDGTYKPADTVNYVELLAINARAQNLADDSQESGEEWFSSYVNLGLTIRLALNNVGFGDPIKGDIFYTITKSFLES